MGKSCSRLMISDCWNETLTSITTMTGWRYDKPATHGLSKDLETECKVLARISKMPVQNSNFKISARPDLATYLLQILIPATFNSLVCQRGQFKLQLCPRRWFVRIIFGYYTPKVKIEKSS